MQSLRKSGFAPSASPLASVIGVTVLILAFVDPAAAHRHSRQEYRPVRYEDGATAIEYARVIDVEPEYRTVRVDQPIRECVEVERYADSYPPPGYRPPYGAPRPNPVGATIAGAVIGGLIGDRFGGGEGRDAMRLLGAITGAAIGHDSATRRYQQPYGYASHARYDDEYEAGPYPATECTTRYEKRTEQRIDGYRVTYEYDGRRYVTYTPDRPGSRIPVEVDVRPIR